MGCYSTNPDRLPTDDELWVQRKKFSSTNWANGINSTGDAVRALLRRRGWDFEPRGVHHRHLTQAPCSKCAARFAIDEREQRLCDDCQPVPVAVDDNIAWARRRMAERELRRAG